MARYVISDHHFDHKNIIKYSKRPFEYNSKGLEDMRIYMIKQWNTVVKPSDSVLHLGDFALYRGKSGKFNFYKDILDELNGEITLFLGNHDKETIDFYKSVGFHDVIEFDIIDGLFINHYPLIITKEYMCEASQKHTKMLQDKYNENECIGLIHGHSHTYEYDRKDFYNVSAELLDYKPIDFDIIKKEFRKRNPHGKFNRIY